MCTVTYIPPTGNNGFILTSNRDEKSFRQTIPPDIYSINGIKTGFPKDAVAGGSWIAANETGRLCCLLNGAFEPHKKQKFHTHSRGNVLIDLVASHLDAMVFFSQESLDKTEPFTMITIDRKENMDYLMTEFVWDGSAKRFKELDNSIPYVWSSVTLYSDENRRMREDWFERFIESNREDISAENIWSFHAGSHTNKKEINLVMEREEGLKTVSITQVTPRNHLFYMRYNDLLKNKEYHLYI